MYCHGSGTMNQITISLIFLIMISMILPASAFMYASGSPQNSDDASSGSTDTSNDGSSSDTGSTDTSNDGSSSDTGSTDTSNDGSSSDTGSTDTSNDGSSSDTGSTDTSNDGSSSDTGSTENNAALPTTSTASNNTGNVTGNGFADTFLPLVNQERTLVGVPPLTWSNTLAADAQAWADHLVATNTFAHCIEVPDWQQFEECTHGEGENLFSINDPPGSTPNPQSVLAQASFDSWLNEKSNYHGQAVTGQESPTETIGHYTQMVWKGTTEIGCASANDSSKGYTVVSCRFLPPGNVMGQTPY